MRLPFFHAHIRETGAQRRSDFHHDEGIQGEKTIPGLNGVARRLRKSPTRSRILQRWNKGRENTSSVRFTRRMARVARRFKLLTVCSVVRSAIIPGTRESKIYNSEWRPLRVD